MRQEIRRWSFPYIKVPILKNEFIYFRVSSNSFCLQLNIGPEDNF